MSDQPDLPSGFNSETYHRKSPRDVAGDESKRLFTIGLGILGALVAVVLVRAFLVARAPQTASHDSAGTPVIAAGAAPSKVAPAAAGGMQVPGADTDGASGSGAANGQLAPATEAPDPGKLASEAPASVPSPLAPATVTPASPAVPSGKAPVANAPALTAGPQLLPANPAQAQAAINGTAAPTVTAEAAPAPRHHAHHGAVPDANTPSSLGVAAVSHHGVQFGALPSAAEAHKEWKRLRAKMPDLLEGRTPMIQTVDHNGTTLYRLRTAGFSTRKEARSFCAKVRGEGGQCLVF